MNENQKRTALRKRSFELCERSGLTLSQTTAIAWLVMASDPMLTAQSGEKLSLGMDMLDERLRGLGK